MASDTAVSHAARLLVLCSDARPTAVTSEANKADTVIVGASKGIEIAVLRRA